MKFLGFGAAFVAAGLLGKLIGCGAGAKICKFSVRDSLRVGLGMMVRAEVVLICTERGVAAGLVDQRIFPFVIVIILLSSVITPIALKSSYRHEERRMLPLPPS